KGKGGKVDQINTGLTLMQGALTGTIKQSDEAISQLIKLNPSLSDIGDIAYDSAGKMRPLRTTLDLLSKGLATQTQQDRNAALATIFGADATRTALALLKGGIPTYDKQRQAVLQQGAAAK